MLAKPGRVADWNVSGGAPVEDIGQIEKGLMAGQRMQFDNAKI